MVILALDTTTKAGSCALWRDGALVEQRPGDAARTHAERLPGDLADLLAAHGLAVKDVDLYAVASGPGSFTGLRVGIATIQGLALVHGRKVVGRRRRSRRWRSAARRPSKARRWPADGWRRIAGKSSARSIASRARDGAAATRDARRSPRPRVGSPGDLATAGRIIQGEAMGGNGGEASSSVTRSPSTRDALSAALPASARLLDPVPLAATIARIAHAHPERATLPHAIVPLYVRRPDAELARDRRDRGDAPVVPA